LGFITEISIMEIKTLVFATGNAHKVEAVNRILGDLPYITIPMKDLGITEDIPETGSTMAENAKQKSDYLYNKLALSCFGEDSGLEIEALNMEPGLYTARYAGPQRNDIDNMNKVLAQMKGVVNRKAQFRAVISLNIEGVSRSFEGIISGRIAYEMSGNQGFGYDPIFIPDGYDMTFAELGPNVKSVVSHRSEAVKKMCNFLATL